MSIKENIEKIRKELPSNIVIVAATKTRAIEEIKQAIPAEIEIIGENYVQEAESKQKELKGKVKVHCIGHLQQNKVKKAVEIFDMIQTVDSLKIAKEIDKRCRAINKIMPILIEVNIGKEENKSGCMPEDVEKIAIEISNLKNIKIKGLMTMGPVFDNPEKYRPYFKEMKKIFDKIKEKRIPDTDMELLSMGMSDSYKIAAEEGANMVRIGAGIFRGR